VTPAHAVDHILAKAKGGTDDPANLEAICRAHHLDKTMREMGRRRKQRIGTDGWAVEE
jgi:5-methylcytosine-specific restriction protein A